MRYVVRRLLVVALALAGSGCARQHPSDIRRNIEIVDSAAGPRVSIYGFTLGMEHARAVERAGGDVNAEIRRGANAFFTSGEVDFGVKAGVLLLFDEGRVHDIALSFEGDHALLERLEARIGEALARFPREEPAPGDQRWLVSGEHFVQLVWEVDREGRESLFLPVVDLALLRGR